MDSANHDVQQTENLIALAWLLLACGVLCFFLADGWMDVLLHEHRTGKPIGYISASINEVRARPRATLSWLDMYRHSGIFSGDTVYVGADSSVTLALADGMKLELGANSLAQISFGSHDTIDVKLAAGTVRVDTVHATKRRLRLDTGREEKVIEGPALRHLVAFKTKAQTLRIVEALPKLNAPTKTIAMVQKPMANDDNILNDFKLSTTTVRAPASVPKLFVGPPAPRAFVGPPAPPPSVLAARLVPPKIPFGNVRVHENDAIDFSSTPEADTQATIDWQPRPKVHAWEVNVKNTDTGKIERMKIDQRELVINGEHPGHYEYIMRGLDSEEKPVTKKSSLVKVDVRQPLQMPIAESPIHSALVVTDNGNQSDFVTLKWQSVEADRYQLQIADSPDFHDAKNIKLKDSMYVLKFDKSKSKVYWRVRALRDRDASAWSSADFQMKSSD